MQEQNEICPDLKNIAIEQNEKKQDFKQENMKTQPEELINQNTLDQLLMEGRVLFNEQKFDEASIKFQETLVKGIKFYNDEVAIQLAKFYYSYGNTLLAKIESQSEFLGEKVKKIAKSKDSEDNSKQIVDGVVIQEENSKKCQNFQEDESQPLENKAEECEDIEIAWENLEVARTLTEKQLDTAGYVEEKNQIIKNLAKIKLRQGDLHAINDNFDSAIQEYNECLKLRLGVECIETSRELAEIYFVLGNAYLYKSIDNSEQTALEFFTKATNCLQALLEQTLNLTGKLFTDVLKNLVKFKLKKKDKELKNKILNREPLKVSFLDNETTKELKSILNIMYDKIEDTLEQLLQKDQFEKEKQDALLFSQGFPNKTKIDQKQVINLGVIKGTGGQKKIIIPTPIQKEKNSEYNLKQIVNQQNQDLVISQENCSQKDEVVRTAQDGFPEKKIKLD